MSRTIAELTAGEKVYLDETIDGVLSHVPYIYLGQDDSGNCIILREAVAIQKRMHSANVAVYDGCEADVWLEDEDAGYLSRFDAATRAALVSTQIKCNSITTGEIGVIARRCFLLSYTELGYATTPDEGVSYLAALQTATGKTGNNARIAYNSAAAAVGWWLRSASPRRSSGTCTPAATPTAMMLRTPASGCAPLYRSRQRPSCPTARRTQSICFRTAPKRTGRSMQLYMSDHPTNAPSGQG